MKARFRFSLAIRIAWFVALLAVDPLWPQSFSQARIIRLSFVEGNVTVQRPEVQAWAEAPVNTPLQQGFKLSTGENSYAEIQFENGGTIRLGQLGLLGLTKLELTSDGSKVNQVNLLQGYATFHPLPSHLGESLQVETPFGMLFAQGSTEFRVDLDQGVERVEVTHGTVEVRSNLGDMTLEKNSVLVMQPDASEPAIVSQGITKDDWDKWVDDRETQMTAGPAGPAPDTYAGSDEEAPYGWSDLLQYGSWADVPGAGYGWIPYGMNAGWSPYSQGQWCWYPGFGYTWIGAEPWGWLPYHYGGWEFIPGKGWIWFPGSFRTWSPGRVTWFSGPGWVGWIPRPRRKDSAVTCGANCGGAAVSASTFRRGGLLTSNLLLGINPTLGERVKEPVILPSRAVKLPGPAVSLPAAQSRNFPRTTSPDSAIVYDPRQDSYINGRPAPTPRQSPSAPSGASAFTPQVSSPSMTQPVPVGSREAGWRSGEYQVLGQPKSATGTSQVTPLSSGRAYRDAAPSGSSNFSARQAPSSTNGNAAGRGGGSQAAESHAGGGVASGGHSSSASAGGGHAGGGSVGGGHH